MRITMNMTTNKMLLNINRNANVVDKLYNQMTSGKKILYPSDDPIIASRALKFRTNVAETEQYQRNVEQGISWMEVTESSFNNMVDIIDQLKWKVTQGGNDMEVSDREKIVNEIRYLVDQICSEVNQSYAGRYVFSGYRTDEPPTFTESNKSAFHIQQEMSTKDIEKTICYYKPGVGQQPEVYENVNRLKLPYQNVTGLTQITAIDSAGVSTSYNVTTMSLTAGNAANNCYTPDANGNDIQYIPETGELILSTAVANAIYGTGNDRIFMEYDKEGFAKGEPNPKVYFNCVQNKDEHGQTGNLASPELPLVFRMTDANRNSTQEFQFEFSVSTRITVNNLAKNSLTASFYADLMDFANELAGIKLSTDAEVRTYLVSLGAPYSNMSEDDLTVEVNKQISDEVKKYRSLEFSRFSNMEALLDKHMAQLSKEHTLLGARMARLDLIQTRLGEDYTSYTKLMSDNEDVDYLDTIMRFNTAQSVYQAALMSGGKIMQLSLADYVR